MNWNEGVNINRIIKIIRLKFKELIKSNILKKMILNFYNRTYNTKIDKNELKEHLNIDRVLKDEIKKSKKNIIEENNIHYRSYNEEFKNHLKAPDFLRNYNQLLENTEVNETMMQYFEWYYPSDGSLWKKVKQNVKELCNVGITALWLPPACKSYNGIYDVGYGIYDLFDLGEFNQKGTIRTKYGTKEEYIAAIEEAHRNNIKIYGDVVFNHKAGADNSEIIDARPVSENNRKMFIGTTRKIRTHTIFTFPGRMEKYSTYKWTSSDFMVYNMIILMIMLL